MKFLREAYLLTFPERTFRVRSNRPNEVKLFDDTLRHLRDTLQFFGDACKQYNSPENRAVYESHKVYQQAIKDKQIANNGINRGAKDSTNCMWNIYIYIVTGKIIVNK